MNYNAMCRVEEDKRVREQRSRLAREESERLARLRADWVETQAKAKAEADHIERERPFNEEVAARLAEYQTKKTN